MSHCSYVEAIWGAPIYRIVKNTEVFFACFFSFQYPPNLWWPLMAERKEWPQSPANIMGGGLRERILRSSKAILPRYILVLISSLLFFLEGIRIIKGMQYPAIRSADRVVWFKINCGCSSINEFFKVVSRYPTSAVVDLQAFPQYLLSKAFRWCLLIFTFTLFPFTTLYSGSHDKRAGKGTRMETDSIDLDPYLSTILLTFAVFISVIFIKGLQLKTSFLEIFQIKLKNRLIGEAILQNYGSVIVGEV